MELPEYDLRKAMCASDPLSVIEGYKIEIYLRLATLCGLRMCPDCPSCNVKGIGCQDKFGSNVRPGGGIFGAAVALGAGTEHQGYGTPHCMVKFMSTVSFSTTVKGNFKTLEHGNFFMLQCFRL